MSASPFIDTYDAPMLDFANDLDVQMNMPGSDSFSPEAIMEHDSHILATTESLFADNESVEVDMESYDGVNTEYEMADETEHYLHYGDELLDVEVHDASATHSPSFPPPADIPDPVQDLHAETSIHSSPAIMHPLPSIDGPEFSHHDISPAVGTSSNEEATVHLDVGLSDERPLVYEHHVDAPEESVTVQPESSKSAVDHLPRSTDDNQLEEKSNTAASLGLTHGADEHQGSARDDGSLPSSVPETHLMAAVSGSSDEPHNEVLSAEHDSAHSNATELQHDHTVPSEDANDPHEISEGVYIDPPPAVLLSIISADESKYCLFNQPSSESGHLSHVGSPDAVPVVGQETLTLLLHHRPTLYYEPLTNVFEAFRQEDLVAQIPDVLEGELVLDAYDLQLTISEDNVYAREVTLHDLNVLHDGSDITGPLRIQLRVAAPRFILRYHLLQDQIARINLAAESADSNNNQADQVFGEESLNEHNNQELTANNVHHDDQAEKHVAEQKDLGPSEASEHVSREEENYEGNQTLLPEAQEYEGYVQAEGEGAESLEEDGFSPSPAGDEDAEGEDLDADALHDVADTDAPVPVTDDLVNYDGEHAEYQDHVQLEEYDERYGEDLPEGAGGEPPEDYNHAPEESAALETYVAVDERQVALPESDTLNEAAEESVFGENESFPQDKQVTPISSADDQDSNHNTVVDNPDSRNHATQRKPDDVNEPSEKDGPVAQGGVDTLDISFPTVSEHGTEADLATELSTDYPEISGHVYGEADDQNEDYGEDWDWNPDVQGEFHEDWIDPEAMSNESSVTLSSKASAKRGHDEVDADDYDEISVRQPPSSPGSKRHRVV
ncbi:hypothetical protein SERLA73DRAFT_76157 [Serpula lacrymans var. lacrymans S7.3]|uniref:Uncharacterized protein n=2 Tax=Serpula lacrymans var. lacrymans TaxID=341189 RepID=F8Q6C9_SERL3|nr:uncharacterized protein SERLADRAFT_440946 [Serpula lacrymans var. lacrymans S7.9]EGN96167.1 hypothetical protein SERLA73DRAFT_76157 [Serpula lacrymans var. lacrymans S7.3]EGO21711.1 hypothetical protein SERLADRAFT_440946 [Serpula lacrymans var. lacrymans S7.9]